MTLLDDLRISTDAPVRMCADAVAPGADLLIAEVLASGRLAQGPKVEAFEAACAEMAGTDHAVAVTNGTVSLELLIAALGIGAGDEVIVPAFTFAASASAVLRAGASVQLVDIAADGTIDVDAVSAAISPRTAAVMAVHLYGLPADLVELTDLCEAHGIALIEDAAQAHGARVAERPVGGWGHGSFSFYATKNVSCGEGGVVTTNDADVAHRVRLLRNQGMVVRHQHELVGTNNRLSELHAALGLASIRQLPVNADRRRRHAAQLSACFSRSSLTVPAEPAGREHAWHQYTVRHPERDRIAAALADQQIETGIHYPRPVHHHPVFADHPDVVADDCPRAVELASTCLSLPAHHDLSVLEIDRVATATLRALEAIR